MIIGFTGTRNGMTPMQGVMLGKWLNEHDVEEAHHGDCIGADAHFHRYLRRYFPSVVIVGHPPIKDKYRAYCDFDRSEPPKDYLARDRDIVNASDALLATPKELNRPANTRSGTWYTVKYALTASTIDVYQLGPDGNVRGRLKRESWPENPS